MPPCKCFMALGRCPMDERRAMEKRLLEGVDELYKLNNLDTELASEHDDRIKHLEERVAALEASRDSMADDITVLRVHDARSRAGGPEPAAELRGPPGGLEVPQAQQQRDSRAAPEQAAAPQPRHVINCLKDGGLCVLEDTWLIDNVCDDCPLKLIQPDSQHTAPQAPKQPRSRGGVE